MKLLSSIFLFLGLTGVAHADVIAWVQFKGEYKVMSVVENGITQSQHTAKIIVHGDAKNWALTWWNPLPYGTATEDLSIGQDQTKYCGNPSESCFFQVTTELTPGKIHHRGFRSYKGHAAEEQIILFESKGSDYFEMIEEWRFINSPYTRIYTLKKNNTL